MQAKQFHVNNFTTWNSLERIFQLNFTWNLLTVVKHLFSLWISCYFYMWNSYEHFNMKFMWGYFACARSQVKRAIRRNWYQKCNWSGWLISHVIHVFHLLFRCCEDILHLCNSSTTDSRSYVPSQPDLVHNSWRLASDHKDIPCQIFQSCRFVRNIIFVNGVVRIWSQVSLQYSIPRYTVMGTMGGIWSEVFSRSVLDDEGPLSLTPSA